MASDDQVAKGTDFPGLLGPIQNTTHPSSEPSEGRSTERGESAPVSSAGEQGSRDGGDGVEGEKVEGQTEGEKEEDMENVVRAGVSTLLPVLGEEFTAKVRYAALSFFSRQGVPSCRYTVFVVW